MTRRHEVKRAFLLGCVAALLPLFSQAQSAATSWPAKPLRIVVGLTAGGPTDTLARIIAQPLAKRLGQPVIVDNRPGASGDIAAEAVAKAAPDGYTLLLGTSGPLSINPSLYGHVPFDPVKDFAPIGEIATAPFVVVVNPKLPARTLGELMQSARQSPGKLNAGSVTGAAAHLATEMFKSAAHIEMAHIPYKGAAPAITDLIAGQIDVSFASTPGALPQIQSGKLRALAVTSARRLPQLPDVPTVAESGVPGFEASVWYGLLAPASTPREVVQRLSRELNAVMQERTTQEQMASNHFIGAYSSPEQFAQFIRAEGVKWGAVVKEKGIRAQ
jgi:tripartite-type tricarboxylate transporter receptor subunit TctC